MKKSQKKNFPSPYIRNLENFQAELNFREKSWKISKITDLPPISLLRHSKGFAASLSFSGEFSRFVELKERGNARERVAPIPNAPRNYLRSIPGTFAEFKDKKLIFFEKKTEKSPKSPIYHLPVSAC